MQNRENKQTKPLLHQRAVRCLKTVYLPFRGHRNLFQKQLPCNFQQALSASETRPHPPQLHFPRLEQLLPSVDISHQQHRNSDDLWQHQILSLSPLVLLLLRAQRSQAQRPRLHTKQVVPPRMTLSLLDTSLVSVQARSKVRLERPFHQKRSG